MTEWQPIKTIPEYLKETETVVWLWDGETRWLGAWSKGSVDPKFSCWRCQGYIRIDTPHWSDRDYQRLSLTSGVIEPTHWMPLPDPPKDTTP